MHINNKNKYNIEEENMNLHPRLTQTQLTKSGQPYNIQVKYLCLLSFPLAIMAK